MTRQTHSYYVGNETAPVFRQHLNNIFNAIQSLNAGSGTPTSAQGLVAHFMFIDTSANTLNIRNSDNDANIVVCKLDQTNDRIEIVTDDIQYASASGTEVKNTSGTTVLSLQVPSQSTATTGTENTQVMTPLRVKQSISANALTSISAGNGLSVSGSTVSMQNNFLQNSGGVGSEFTNISGTSFTNQGNHPVFVSGRSNAGGGSFTFTVTVGGTGKTLDMRDGDSGTNDTFATILPVNAILSSTNSFTGLAVPLVVG